MNKCYNEQMLLFNNCYIWYEMLPLNFVQSSSPAEPLDDGDIDMNTLSDPDTEPSENIDNSNLPENPDFVDFDLD